MEETPVLIIGAGPTGLALAYELLMQSTPFRIVDKEPGRSDKSRALAVHSRTMELLDRHDGDVHEQMVAKGNPLQAITWFLSPTRTARLSFADMGLTGTEFPRSLVLSQAETERFLEEKLEARGVRVERGVRAEGIEQDGEGVNVRLVRCAAVAVAVGGSDHLDEDGEDTAKNDNSDNNNNNTAVVVRAKYVVGCDGSHSVVRHAAKTIRFEGEAYPHDFILCDAHLRPGVALALDGISVSLKGGSFVGAFPMSRRRGPEDDDDPVLRVGAMRAGVERQGEPTLDEFDSLLREVLPGAGGEAKNGTAAEAAGAGQSPPPPLLHSPLWITKFNLHRRCASSYREGRLLLAGDAAHIHSPVGGQGMNTSVQDAVNLGWKLAAVVRNNNNNNEALLDTYCAERRPVGLALTEGTDRAFRFMTVRNPLLVRLRTLLLPWVLPRLVSSPARRARVFNWVSEFAVSYRGSGLVGTGTAFASSSSSSFLSSLRSRLLPAFLLPSRPLRGGDRLPDGRLLGPGGERTTLQRLCGGRGHALLVFAGDGAGSGAASEGELARVARCAAGWRGDATAGLRVSTLVVGEGEGEAESGRFRDVDGGLHARYGFGARPGYVLARPDGYVAHIGFMGDLGELEAFLKGYI